MGGALSGHRWRALVAECKRVYPWVCWLCHQRIGHWPPRHPRSYSVDHVIPRSKGGSVYDITNCRPAHYGCNSSRQAKAQPVRWISADDW
ncbi:HNH endonuclease [Micromonospora tulbaghiae]|uniref:HNH endonuclease n=1 Tax=Micromonospora tulbaghiae TaxID=479978 RepID=UPI00372060E1